MKIAWITPSAFVDVDLPILVELQKDIDIFWQIIVYGRVNDDLVSFIESQLSPNAQIQHEYVEIPYRVFDPRTLNIYIKTLNKAKAFAGDLLYTSLGTAPFGPWVYKIFFPKKKIIVACHNVTTPKGANQELYNRFYTWWTLKSFNNIQVFSGLQRDTLLQKHPSKNVLLAPLAIKDYGEPSIAIKPFDENKVVFLFFGIISPYKRLDLLIDASQRLYERGYNNFMIKIAGSCKTWSDYQHLIKYPGLFDLRIERIPNAEVANLFAECDYFAMPYQDIAQSGAITVAFRYNLPIILSDLPQFRPYGEDGNTCFFFESNNVEDLIEKMKIAIDGGQKLHDTLCKGLRDFVNERYSTSAIAKKYLDFFCDLIDKQ